MRWPKGGRGRQGGGASPQLWPFLLRAVGTIGIIIAPGNIGQGDESGGPGDLDWNRETGRYCTPSSSGLPPGAMY